MPDSSNCPSFLCDRAGGLGLPPEASGRGAPRPSRPLALSEQHDGERRPARAQRERPHGRLPAVQEPPGADGLPAAGLGCRPAKASPQNAPGALRLRIPVRQLKRSPTGGRHLTAGQPAAHAPFFWIKGGSGMGNRYFYLILFFMME